jgi:ribosome maturation protein SDO1
LNYTLGKPASVSEILVADTIFTDANKGTKAGEDKLQAAFNTLDPRKIAEVILSRGTLQLTTDQRRQLTAEKRKQIIAFIVRQAVDPKTNMPHPPLRIEQAMEQRPPVSSGICPRNGKPRSNNSGNNVSRRHSSRCRRET